MRKQNRAFVARAAAILRIVEACGASGAAALGCSAGTATNAGENGASAATASTPASPAAPATTRGPGGAGAATETGTGTAAAAVPAGSMSAGAWAPGATGSAGATGAPAPADGAAGSEALPKVKVVNIGMHVGGGKNDAAEKEPIKRSVEPHFDAFKRCFASVAEPKKGGDFGVDLRIDKDGGKAKVSHPRTSLKGAGFEACVVGVFEAIDFRKPKGGTTVVSYSLRFTPISDGA